MSGNVDVAIRYGSGQYPGLRVERLIGEEVIPVCSPALRDGDRPLARPEDLVEHALLHDDSPDNDPSCPTWPMWLRAAGVQGVDAIRGPHFSQSSLVLEAAVLGRGVALAKATIAAADLAAGKVVPPLRDERAAGLRLLPRLAGEREPVAESDGFPAMAVRAGGARLRKAAHSPSWRCLASARLGH